MCIEQQHFASFRRHPEHVHRRRCEQRQETMATHVESNERGYAKRFSSLGLNENRFSSLGLTQTQSRSRSAPRRSPAALAPVVRNLDERFKQQVMECVQLSQRYAEQRMTEVADDSNRELTALRHDVTALQSEQHEL